MVDTKTIEIQKTSKSRINEVDFDNIPFGRVFSDHMFTLDYQDGNWQTGKIMPYQSITMSPASSALHYGQAIFEGMKAEIDANGNPVMFRPEKNIERFNISAERLSMPPVPENLFLEGLKELLALDRQWIPTNEGSSLYIRPFMFATDPYIGVKPSQSYTFIIFTCPVGPYYAGDVNVYIENKYSRSCDGGVGFAKAAGNYAAALYPATLVAEKGYNQILWTDSNEHKYVQEIGTMNVVFMIDGKAITPNLDGNILNGVTRRSVLQLIKDEGVTVEERPITVDEIIEASKNGTLQDCFGTGTAAVITHINKLGHDTFEHQFPPISERTLSNRVKAKLVAIKRKEVEDTYGWTVTV